MRGQGRIFTRGCIPWIAYFRNGKEVRESGGTALLQAEAKRRRPLTDHEATVVAQKFLETRLREVANEREGLRPFIGPQQEKLTVEDLVGNYEQDCEIRQLKSRKPIRSHLKHIREFFGQGRALAVTGERLRGYIQARQGEGAKPATINRELEGLQAAFNSAVDSGRLALASKFPSLPEHNARQGFFERGDFLRVLSLLGDTDLTDFLEWFYWTGMRPAEIRALSWNCLDRETATLRLPAKDAKTGFGRVLALEDPLREIIECRTQAQRPGCELIFCRTRKGKPVPVGEFRKRWKTACAFAGVSGKNPYDLRRTAVRNLVRSGTPEAVAMRISGHRTRSVFDRYNIVSENDLREAITKTAAYVESLPVTPTTFPAAPQAVSKRVQ